VEFGTRGLYRAGLLRLPWEADAVTTPDQFTGDAEGRRHVPAGGAATAGLIMVQWARGTSRHRSRIKLNDGAAV
jgi:hypothetical protein